MRKHIPWIFTLAMFIAEWFLLNQLITLDKAGTITPCYAIFVLLVPLALWLIVGTRYYVGFQIEKKETGKAKHLLLLTPFIRLMKSEVGTFNGIVSVLFILFNLAWTQDLLLECIKGDGPWLYPAFTFLCLVVPFVWVSGLPEKNKKIDRSKRKLLITGLSLQTTTPDKNDKFFSKNYEGWCANWEPVRAALLHYPNLEKVLILHSAETYKQANETYIKDIEKHFNNGPIKSLKELIQKSVSHPIEVEEAILPNQERFDEFFPILKSTIESYLSRNTCKDEDVVFSINGGTAILTSGMAFLSMPGRRGCVYSDQNWDRKPLERLQEFEVDIYSIKELWKEIIEQTSGGKDV